MYRSFDSEISFWLRKELRLTVSRKASGGRTELWYTHLKAVTFLPGIVVDVIFAAFRTSQESDIMYGYD